jgi:tRNA(Ile)-lysidine synthase
MFESIKFLKSILHNNDKVIVSCSGGPDSMCLLSLIISLRSEYNLEIICAHVNHGVREESNKEEKFVHDFCNKHQVAFEVLNIEGYQHQNFHDEARILRYNFLDKLMQKYNAKYLLTAHHGDDLMETILMRLERGSNLTGYIGFKKISNYHSYQILRPLVFYTKSEIKAYDDASGIDYVIDASNLTDDYTRNRYRHHVLPLLKEELDNIHLKYLAFSEELSKYDEYLKRIIDKEKIIDSDYINLDTFNKQDPFIQEKTIQYYISNIQKDNLFYVTNNITTEILKLIKSTKVNATISLPNDFVGVKEYNKFYILKNQKKLNYCQEFNNHFENDCWLIETVVTIEDNSNFTFRLNSSDIKMPIYIRTRKNGDKMLSKNLKGSQKLKDIFIDAKIPMNKRDTWPIIVDANDTILGIPGIKKSKFIKDISQKYDIIIKCKEK